MVSSSSLTISWLPPEIEEERWEFFNHPAKQEWYRLHDVRWELLVSGSPDGRLVPYPRDAAINGIPVALSYHSYSEYQIFLAKAKRGYRKSYSRMEDELQKLGHLELKAPIVILSNDNAILFSGYRRLCLAWNYGMIPYIWLVELEIMQAGNFKCEAKNR